MPLNPSEWSTQVYSVGASEYYIDLCMPLSKANSSKVFCHWVTNWVKAFKSHHRQAVTYYFVLESYVDDVFGGATEEAHGLSLIQQLIAVGKLTTAVMNLLKCEGPAQELDILGLRYHAILRRVTITAGKQVKYLSKLRAVLSSFGVTSKDLEQLLGYLGFAS